ncbi:MAG: hypothetical protein IH588_03485 [Anaerolineales bacterium]|nr:hypothetical protein [Anaerolineales bacterium]
MKQENASGKTKLNRLAVLLGIGMPLVGLALLAYMGIYNRFWGDDWCYNFDFKTLGIGGTLNTYFMTGHEALRGYANNRYSLTLVSGLLYLTGIFGAKITASLVIASWLAGLTWTFSNLSKIFKINSKSAVILSAVTILYFTLYISPQRFQVLYWIAGIHYSLTIVTGIFLLALITSQAVRETRSKAIDYIIIPVAFLAGGFSETGSAFLLGAFSLLLVTVWYLKWKQTDWAIKAFPTTVIAFVTLAIALLVLASAPSNAARTDVISAERTELFTAILLSFRFAFDFMLDSFLSLPLPHVMFLAVFFALPILSSTEKRADLLKTLLSALAVTVVLWLIISAVQAPSVLFYGAPPDPRGKSLARFTMLVGLAVIAWLFGREIHSRWDNKWMTAIAIATMVISAAYTARTITNTYKEVSSYAYRAQKWDERDAHIQQAIREGQTLVEVTVIDMKGLGVQDIMKSKDMNGEWIVSCSSQFYGFKAIKAEQP